MAKDEIKLHKNLDDMFDELEKDATPNIKEAFKKYDKFKEDDNLDHYYNNVFTPAVNEMYKGFTEALDKTFKKDDAKVYGKKKDLKKAAIEGMKKFFKKVHPSLLESVKDITDDDILYERLASKYNEHVGATEDNGRGIELVVEGYSRDRKASVGTVKKGLHGQIPGLTQGGVEYIKGKHTNKYIGNYRSHIVANHVRKEIERRRGYKVNMTDFGGLRTKDILDAREGIKTGKYKQNTDLGQYGITYEEAKDK